MIALSRRGTLADPGQPDIHHAGRSQGTLADHAAAERSLRREETSPILTNPAPLRQQRIGEELMLVAKGGRSNQRQ
jgi:hypothetical protein